MSTLVVRNKEAKSTSMNMIMCASTFAYIHIVVARLFCVCSSKIVSAVYMANRREATTTATTKGGTTTQKNNKLHYRHIFFIFYFMVLLYGNKALIPRPG